MIWYFLAGFIAGAVGMVMFSDWQVRKHKEFLRQMEQDRIKAQKRERELTGGKDS